MVKNPPANARDLRDAGLIPGSGNPLEKGMATHSNIRAWRIPWIEEPGELQSMGCKESDMTEQLMHKNIIIVYILKRLFKIVCIVLNVLYKK